MEELNITSAQYVANAYHNFCERKIYKVMDGRDYWVFRCFRQPPLHDKSCAK